MPTVLITGANRGLGLEFARQYTADGWRVVAASSRGRVTVHALDVLFDNAGSMGRESFAEKGPETQHFGYPDYADWLDTLRVNLLGPVKMAEAFVDNVAASEQKKIVTLASIAGLIGQGSFGDLCDGAASSRSRCIPAGCAP